MANQRYLIKSPYHADVNCTKGFLHTDSKELFELNKKRQPADWKWHTTPIVYKLNKLGYRMDKELEEVNYDNYFAFFGCSYVAGIGLPKEDTFAHIISQHYLKDYVNGAIGGSGVEFALYNLVQLLTDAPKVPKAIIINWPDACRGLYWYKGIPSNFVPGFDGDKGNNHWKEIYKYWGEPFERTALEVSHIANRFRMIRTTVQLICKAHQIPLFETGFLQSYSEVDMTGVTIIPYQTEFGRDIMECGTMGHPGRYFHDEVFTKFKEFVKTNRLTLQ